MTDSLAPLRLGEPARAAVLFDESLALHRSMDNRRGVCVCLAGLAGVAAETGRAECAEAGGVVPELPLIVKLRRA